MTTSPTAHDGADLGPITTGLRTLRPLLGELNDLKRIRVSGSAESLASAGFSRSWRILLAGIPAGVVARQEAARALASARLGGIDRTVLQRSGLDEQRSLSVLLKSFDSASAVLDRPFASSLRSALDHIDVPAQGGGLPWFVAALADQPRAGATRPGRARLILEPPESHAEHCYIAAVYAVLVGGAGVSDPGSPFLAGLSHHLHNATLPDSGFAGEALLGEELEPIVARLNAEALAAVPDWLAEQVRRASGLISHAGTAEARAFHAADVLDRVLQMEHYARAASFTTDVAIEEMDLVHEGPLQAFQKVVLREAGLLR